MSTSWLGGPSVVTQGFGVCELAGDCPHTGIDVAAAYGTPIIDQIAGTVRDIADATGFGLHQVIDIGGGRQILLGHESAFAVPSGTYLKPGMVAGYEGSTGFSTGPHLHFEEDVNGVPIDPSQALFNPGSVGGQSPCIKIPGTDVCVPGSQAGVQAGEGAAAGSAAIAGAISSVPTQIGHGLADFFAISLHDAEVFMRRQALAMFVGIAVVIALFGLERQATS